MLIALVAVLGGFSLYLNRDWFAKDRIQIYHRSRPARASFIRRKRSNPGGENPSVDPIIFGFDRSVKLTSIEVVPVAELETNKYTRPLWHMVSESNSVATRDFAYGAPVRGMHPAIKGANPDPLEPGVKYRLRIEAGSFKGEHDFVPLPWTP